jgi:hypothetical protein
MFLTKRNIFLIILVFALCAGCASKGQNNFTATPTLLSPTFTVLPSATFSPSPTTTETLVPTLAPDVARDALFQMIRTNGNCNLPCWWGITPGTSTGSNIYSALAPFSAIASDKNLSQTKPGGMQFYFTTNNYNVLLALGYLFLEDNGPIGIIGVQIMQTKGKQYTPYSDVFSRYSLQNILSVNGPPTKVELIAGLHKFDPNSGTTFQTYLSYPDKGIYLRYTTPAEEISGNRIQSCPSEAYVDLWLTPPEKNNTNMKLLTGLNMEWSYSRTSLQDATQMSIDQFYEKFKNQPNQCLITPKSIWTP